MTVALRLPRWPSFTQVTTRHKQWVRHLSADTPKALMGIEGLRVAKGKRDARGFYCDECAVRVMWLKGQKGRASFFSCPLVNRDKVNQISYGTL